MENIKEKFEASIRYKTILVNVVLNSL